MALQALKKLTIRDVMKGSIEYEDVDSVDGKGNKIKVKVAKAADIVAIYGRAVNHRDGETALGEYREFIGTFEAKRIADGETFQSTRFIAPPITDDLLTLAYNMAKQEDESAQVDFAFVIGVEPDLTPNSAKGFKFTCKPMVAGRSPNDPLSELRKNLAAQFAETLGADTAKALGFVATPALESKAGKKQVEAA